MNTEKHDTVVSIISTGGPSLPLAITALLTGTYTPKAISLSLTGERANFDNFYLAQLADLARIKSCGLSFSVGNYHGIRNARDLQLAACVAAGVRYCIMLDDDVVVESHTLSRLYQLARHFDSESMPFGCICANKVDVNNIRGYKDFSSAPVVWRRNTEPETYLNWEGNFGELEYSFVTAVDTGCALINAPLVTDKGIHFQCCDVHYDSGGEDTSFGLQCKHMGLYNALMPAAKAWHLEKPQAHFTQHAARCEATLRTAELKGWANGKDEFAAMKWVTKHSK